MQSIRRTYTVAVVLILLPAMTSCALWPRMKDDTALTPSDAQANPCVTSSYDIASKCAQLTISELSDWLQSVSDYKQGTAYMGLGIGVLTGANVAFDGGDAGLRELAVAAGSLVGLNTVVDPQQQVQIASTALKNVQCMYSATEAVQEAATRLGSNSPSKDLFGGTPLRFPVYDSKTALATINNKFHLDTVKMMQSVPAMKNRSDQDVWKLAVDFSSAASAQTEQADAVHRMRTLRQAGADTIRALNEANLSAAKFLSDTVVSTRAKVRKELASRNFDLKGLIESGRSEVDAYLKSFLEARDRQRSRDQEGGGDVPPAVVGGGEVTTASALLLQETSGIEAAYKSCVGDT